MAQAPIGSGRPILDARCGEVVLCHVALLCPPTREQCYGRPVYSAAPVPLVEGRPSALSAAVGGGFKDIANNQITNAAFMGCFRGACQAY
jgi:hypothetical protein